MNKYFIIRVVLTALVMGTVLMAEATAKTVVSAEIQGMAKQIDPTEAARCGIVLSRISRALIDQGDKDTGINLLAMIQATSYVVNVAVSSGQSQQQFKQIKESMIEQTQSWGSTKLHDRAKSCI